MSERDAHLLAALRHAPDHAVEPPAALTAAILDQAHRALRPPRAGGARLQSALRGAFEKFWRPAPMAAFGSLAMATLIGVMWGGGQAPEAVPSALPERGAAAPSASSSATVAPLSPPSPLSSVPPVPQDGLGARETTATAPRSHRQAPAPTTKAADPVQQRAAMPSSASEVAAARQDAAPAPVTAPAAMTPAQRSEAAAAPVPATPSTAAQSETLAKSLTDAARAPARARSELAAPALGALAAAGPSPLAAAGATIDAATAGDAARVRWRVNAQRQVAHDAAQRDWWSALVRATQGRWQAAAPGAASGAESEPLSLLIDGAVYGTLSFEPQALVWRDAAGVTWRAPVPAPTLRGWQEAFALW